MSRYVEPLKKPVAVNDVRESPVATDSAQHEIVLLFECNRIEQASSRASEPKRVWQCTTNTNARRHGRGALLEQ